MPAADADGGVAAFALMPFEILLLVVGAVWISSARRLLSALPETPGATRIVPTSTAPAPTARRRRDVVAGLYSSPSLETRDTSSERSSAMPATGTPSGDA